MEEAKNKTPNSCLYLRQISADFQVVKKFEQSIFLTRDVYAPLLHFHVVNGSARANDLSVQTSLVLCIRIHCIKYISKLSTYYTSVFAASGRKTEKGNRKTYTI